MFYNVYDLEIDGFTQWSGKLYVRKNETIKESCKRHFPDSKWDNPKMQYMKSKITLINEILVEDLKDYLIDNLKIIEV